MLTMRWLLTENPAAFRVECTGFGLNLVSGNFEFACLIVIESDEFWSRFGGQIEASWESSSLRQYSSLDDGSLAALASDSGWSNEGLFAFLQGLRRLGQIGGGPGRYTRYRLGGGAVSVNWYTGNAAEEGKERRGWSLVAIQPE